MQTSQGRSDGLPSSTLLKGRVPGKVSANARASPALADTFPAAFITLRRKNWKQAEKLNSGLYYRQKKSICFTQMLFFMYVTRFELATFWSVARRSIQLSYTYNYLLFFNSEINNTSVYGFCQHLILKK